MERKQTYPRVCFSIGNIDQIGFSSFNRTRKSQMFLFSFLFFSILIRIPTVDCQAILLPFASSRLHTYA